MLKLKTGPVAFTRTLCFISWSFMDTRHKHTVAKVLDLKTNIYILGLLNNYALIKHSELVRRLTVSYLTPQRFFFFFLGCLLLINNFLLLNLSVWLVCFCQSLRNFNYSTSSIFPHSVCLGSSFREIQLRNQWITDGYWWPATVP